MKTGSLRLRLLLAAAVSIALAQSTPPPPAAPEGWIIVDAGWMAMSRDRGTASHAVDQGYGVVCDAAGRVIEDLLMVATNQEHGILALRPG